MHGDYAFLNVMFAHGPTPRLAGIVDREMSTVDDPLLDLAWLLKQWPEDDSQVITRYVDYTGMPFRAEIKRLYGELSGLPLDDFRYYEVLANFKGAIVLEGGYARYLKGEVDNPKVAAYNESILESGRIAAALVQNG